VLNHAVHFIWKLNEDSPKTPRMKKQNREHNAHDEDGSQDRATRMQCAKLADFVKQFRIFHAETSGLALLVSRIGINSPVLEEIQV
jgi:hypothetical protein